MRRTTALTLTLLAAVASTTALAAKPYPVKIKEGFMQGCNKHGTPQNKAYCDCTIAEMENTIPLEEFIAYSIESGEGREPNPATVSKMQTAAKNCVQKQILGVGSNGQAPASGASAPDLSVPPVGNSAATAAPVAPTPATPQPATAAVPGNTRCPIQGDAKTQDKLARAILKNADFLDENGLSKRRALDFSVYAEDPAAMKKAIETLTLPNDSGAPVPAGFTIKEMEERKGLDSWRFTIDPGLPGEKLSHNAYRFDYLRSCKISAVQ